MSSKTATTRMDTTGGVSTPTSYVLVEQVPARASTQPQTQAAPSRSARVATTRQSGDVRVRTVPSGRSGNHGGTR